MYKRKHHQVIAKLLTCFNSEYLNENNILFGGGTRIALELDEYRESVNVDFLCMNTPSYRAVRTQATNVSLGELLLNELNFVREIRMDRYAVRAFVEIDDVIVKLEFVALDDYQLTKSDGNLFCLPYINQQSCFLTKLLAHSDRQYAPDKKDLFDLLMMFQAWGLPTEVTWQECDRHYGKAPKQDLINALQLLNTKPELFIKAGKALAVSEQVTQTLLNDVSPKLFSLLSNKYKNT